MTQLYSCIVSHQQLWTLLLAKLKKLKCLKDLLLSLIINHKKIKLNARHFFYNDQSHILFPRTARLPKRFRQRKIQNGVKQERRQPKPSRKGSTWRNGQFSCGLLYKSFARLFSIWKQYNDHNSASFS